MQTEGPILNIAAPAFDSSGSGIPLACLHPIGLDHTCWKRLALALNPGFRVIAFDLAGHGVAEARPKGMTLAQDAERVAETLERIDCGPVVTVGVSMGGMVAQELALARPDLVSHLVAGACPPRISPENRESLRARGRSAIENGMAAVADGAIERWFTSGFRTDPAAQAAFAVLLGQDPVQFARAWESISHFDLADSLHLIVQPTLCLAGGVDVATPREAMERLAAGVQRGRLQIVENAPHMLHIETAEAFGEAVRAFLDAH
ncbi:alpha/beta fold hydrolase [Loktanella sp. M215]|uniref:alpha/beta fold hydrolase n=1 Tax=Loktanella sp. M215 TaxID=2675431 RepID=UPI001F19B0DC|nr:alpha/beta fold hydrolase [Loktanella sp. M215]MCF7701798.1 alpha/beta fold hydrolase [Loktanella sp. M215]